MYIPGLNDGAGPESTALPCFTARLAMRSMLLRSTIILHGTAGQGVHGNYGNIKMRAIDQSCYRAHSQASISTADNVTTAFEAHKSPCSRKRTYSGISTANKNIASPVHPGFLSVP
uniref:Uncharacterized protein n=1 Tax=Arundo donax TaxID=35708 RepID=A0A0A9FUI5_ARUDO